MGDTLTKPINLSITITCCNGANDSVDGECEENANSCCCIPYISNEEYSCDEVNQQTNNEL